MSVVRAANTGAINEKLGKVCIEHHENNGLVEIAAEPHYEFEFLCSEPVPFRNAGHCHLSAVHSPR